MQDSNPAELPPDPALDPVQKLIELAAEGVRRSMIPPRLGDQRLSYLAEALKMLNRSWALVRAVYGPEHTVPVVREFRLLRVLPMGDAAVGQRVRPSGEEVC